MRIRNGFTLAELLTALLILGVIATFTIPKILQSQADSKKRAVFRETLSAINEALYMGTLQGNLTAATVPATYFVGAINAVKVCPTDASAEGCWTQAYTPGGEQFEGGLLMHNGSTVGGLADVAIPSQGADAFILDWNGSQPPNVDGDDQLSFMACYDKDAPFFPAECNGREGIITWIPVGWGDSAASQALFTWIFAN